MGRHLDEPGQYLRSCALVKPHDKALEEHLLWVGVVGARTRLQTVAWSLSVIIVTDQHLKAAKSHVLRR